MSTSRVVEAVEVSKQGDLGRAACGPGLAPDHLSLDPLEKRLGGGVIITISPAAHALPDSAYLHEREGKR